MGMLDYPGCNVKGGLTVNVKFLTYERGRQRTREGGDDRSTGWTDDTIKL